MNLVKLLLNTLLVFSTLATTFSQELIELNERNLITLRGPIKHESVSDFMTKTSQIDSNDVYIYISSPGGSVMEGMKIVDMINSMEKSGKNVSCISDFSASIFFESR